MRPQNKRAKKSRIKPFFAVLVLAGYSAWAILRPLPPLQPMPVTKQFSVPSPVAQLVWPSIGQSAVTLVDEPILEQHGMQTPVPIASTAKVITALTVLQKKPLKPGEQGPSVTITDADVAAFNFQSANDGSVLPVALGETISEYQMLQALMLPSANNIADTLALWAFGSQEAYASAATTYLASHGMENTHIGTDASGLAPTTTSTAVDLARLGTLAIKEPVLAEIVAQPSAKGIPLVDTIKNVNSLLGTSNIIGVKTGNTEQAGGVFISASKITVNKQPKTIVTAVAGSSNLFSALSDSLSLVRSAQSNFSPVNIIRKGDVIARYDQPWGDNIAAKAQKTVTDTVWKGSKASATATVRPLAIAENSLVAGQIKSSGTNSVTSSIDLEHALMPPSLLWRLTHPF